MNHNFIKLFFICFFVISSQLHAYTDPGSGALIWQLLMASFVGILFYVKSIYAWVLAKFNKTPKSEPEE
jgi:hypothetical protein